MYRPRPKYAEVDPDNPSAWGSCARCGFQWNLNRLQWQSAYQGSLSAQNTMILVCPNHIDPLNPQDQPVILSPDPIPIFNARPEPYVLDESSWLSTQDGETISTQSGEDFTTAIPNPESDAVAGEDSVVEEAAVLITTEDGLELVTEEGDGNPLDYEPNP